MQFTSVEIKQPKYDLNPSNACKTSNQKFAPCYKISFRNWKVSLSPFENICSYKYNHFNNYQPQGNQFQKQRKRGSDPKYIGP